MQTQKQTFPGVSDSPVIIKPDIERPSLFQIIRKKIYDWLSHKNTTVNMIIKRISLLIITAWLTMLLVSPFYALLLLQTVSLFYNSLIPKFIIIYLLVHNYGIIKRYFIKRFYSKKPEVIQGIPKQEIIHFLFENGHFKFNDVKAKFGINERRYNTLSKSMRDKNILVKGENNSNVLNPELSRQQVFDSFRDIKNINQLLLHVPIIQGGQCRTKSLDQINDDLFTIHKIDTS